MAVRRFRRIEEAMIYILTNEGRGLTVSHIVALINAYKLYVKKDGTPVTEAYVWRTIFVNPQIFVREGTIIHLLM